MVIFICQLGLRIGRVLIIRLTINILHFIHFVLATGLPQIIFKLFHRI